MPRADYCFDRSASTKAASTRCAFMAKLGSQPILAKIPLAARKRGRRSIAPHAVARTRRRRKAGVSDRPSRRPAGRRSRGPRCWRMGGAWRRAGRDSLLISHGYHERGAMTRWVRSSARVGDPERCTSSVAAAFRGPPDARNDIYGAEPSRRSPRMPGPFIRRASPTSPGQPGGTDRRRSHSLSTCSRSTALSCTTRSEVPVRRFF